MTENKTPLQSQQTTQTSTSTVSTTTNTSTLKPVQPKRKVPLNYILGAILLLVVLLGGIVGFYLMRQNQDLRQQASVGNVYNYCDRSGPNTTMCTDKLVGTGCSPTSNLSASGSCQIINLGSSNGANTECECRVGTGPTVPPTATPSQCVSAGASCSIKDDGTSTCCGGLACQNGLDNGQPRCEDPGANVCPDNGVCGGNGGWIGFRCNNLTNGQCLENSQTFNSYGAALSYAGSCGQVDEVCVGGSKNRQACGDFNVISSGCGQPTIAPTTIPTVPPTSTPTPTPIACGTACTVGGTPCTTGHTCNTGTCKLNACLVTGTTCTATKCAVVTASPTATPSPTPIACGIACTVGGTPCSTGHTCNTGTCKLDACLVAGATCNANKCEPLDGPAPICLNITASKTTGIVVGNKLTFTCGTVANVDSYQFEVRTPTGTVQALSPLTLTSNVSQEFTVTAAGAHQARCQVCRGTTCSGWEAWPPVIVID